MHLGRFFIGYGLELSRLIPLIVFHVKRKFFIKTERELFNAWQPGAFRYHTNIPNDLLIVTLALCYATIAPMILFFSFLYFFIGWLVQRNQVSTFLNLLAMSSLQLAPPLLDLATSSSPARGKYDIARCVEEPSV